MTDRQAAAIRQVIAEMREWAHTQLDSPREHEARVMQWAAEVEAALGEAPAAPSEADLNQSLRDLAGPSIEAWELFWPLEDEQRTEMRKMLASFAAMVIVHHAGRYSARAARPQEG